MTRLRYAKGSGHPPLHLASITANGAEAGELRFTLANAEVLRIAFASHAEQVRMLERLITERVPFAVGGMCPGPADEVDMLIATAELAGPYIELAWTAPQQWVVRETSSVASEWLQVAEASMIANPSFDPNSLKFFDCPTLR